MPAISGSDKALMYSLSGVLRAGAGRSGYTSSKLFFSINGIEYGTNRAATNQYIKQDTLTIHPGLDGTPGTAEFVAKGFLPPLGSVVALRLGSTHNDSKLFAGTILNRTKVYIGTPGNPEYPCNVIDYTWGLNKRKVIGVYTNLSATTIAQAIISTYCSGYTSLNVVASLPTIDVIQFTNEEVTDALTRLAKRIGGYWYIDYNKDLHFYQTDLTISNPVALVSGLRTLINDSFSWVTDLSQVVTRVYCEGGGVNALADTPVGATLLPVDNSGGWYNAAGGTVVCGPQRLTYTGVQPGGGGSLVGPGIAPATALTVTPSAGAGIESGLHQYAQTFVTASGESIPSPLASVTMGAIAGPAVVPNAVAAGPYDSVFNDGLVRGASYTYKATYSIAALQNDYTQETAATAASANCVPVQNLNFPTHTSALYATISLVVPSTVVTWVRLWRTTGNGSTYYLLSSGAPGTGSLGGYDTTSDAFLVTQQVLPSAGAALNQATIAGVAIGPPGVTQRKIYRTVAAGSTLKLQQTIANNTALTGVTDSTADASLGATAPTTDTSALAQPKGQVIAGSTSIPVAGITPFSATGGLAIIGQGQVVSYTGTLTGGSPVTQAIIGIPASGAGSIVGTIPYNSTITAAPTLKGIPASGAGSILYAIKQGDPVNLLVQEDSTTGQTALATLIGGDGIQEDYLQDNRLGETEARARALAQLALRGNPETTLQYQSRDLNSQPGRFISTTLLPDYLSAVLSDGPVAYWRLGETSGTTADEYYGRYNAVYTGSPTLGVVPPTPVDDRNAAITLNGTTQYVSTAPLTLASPLLFGTINTPRSFEFWINKSAAPASEQTVISLCEGTPKSGWQISISTTGRVHFLCASSSFGDPVDTTGTASVCNGQWHHVVCVWTGTTAANGIAIYLDAVLDKQATAAGNQSDPVNDSLVIGATTPLTQFLSASVDEVAIFNYALSSTQVLNHYTGTGLAKSFKIQRVSISQFTPAINPLFEVEASSTKFSLEDLLRLIPQAKQGTSGQVG
jgi:hypothetical protein